MNNRTKLRVGIACSDTPRFFTDIAGHLRDEFDTWEIAHRELAIPLLRSRVNDFRLHRDLTRMMARVDVALFEWAADYLIRATRVEKRCKIVTRMHQYELFRLADRVNWDRVDKVIVVSSGMRRAFEHYLPQHAEKCVVIPGGIRLDRFRPRERRFSGSIGVLATLEPRKRVYEIVLAFHELVRRGHDLKLYVGGGIHPRFRDYHWSLVRLVEKLSLGERVFFEGRIDDPASWFEKIDIHVSNSYAEGLQVSPMEASASGCFGLTHFWDGCEDIFPPEQVFSTESELVEMIERYCSLPDAGRAKARERQRAMVVEKCDVFKVREQISELIRAVAAS